MSGQYLTLKTVHNGVEVRRSYSLCTAPFEKEWRVAVKKVENGLFSSYANEHLNAGDVMEVMTPTGNFQLKPDVKASKNYVLFAAGSGITPQKQHYTKNLNQQSRFFMATRISRGSFFVNSWKP